MTKQIHKCISLLKRQTNRCIVASIHDTFQTNVSYDMPLNILLNHFQQVRRSMGAAQPLLTALCCTRVPSQMPESSCTAFPSSAWMHPGLTFAQKIQNIWSSSSTLYALFLIWILSSPLHLLQAWSNWTMQLRCPGVSSDRGKLDFFLAVFRGTSRQINSSLSNERVAALPVHETYLARYIIYRSGDVPCSGGSTNRRS